MRGETAMTPEELQQIRERWSKARWAYQEIGQAWNDIDALLDYITTLQGDLAEARDEADKLHMELEIEQGEVHFEVIGCENHPET